MLKLYNTMSRSVETFKSIEPSKVKIFACGPSIYQRPHIGNYRTFLYEDLTIKYLRYSGYKIKHAIILTDIEDKALIEAKKKNSGVAELTDKAAKKFFQEAKLLNIELPDPVPSASKSIDQAVILIKRLMEKGYAYKHKNDIFFDAMKFKDFGKLFRLDKTRWPKKKVRFRRDTYNGRRWNLGDFILWHGYKEGEDPSWDTEIGKGRPSWNIQDPSVISKFLGEQVDINCGGIDNIFRHHDYNIAVMEAFSGKKYANFYMHGEHLIIKGKSMSKSRGNILYPEDIFKKYKPYHLRFFLLYTHYRKKLNLTDEKLKKSSQYLDSLRALVKELTSVKKKEMLNTETALIIKNLKTDFEKLMDDDLKFGAAFDGIFLKLNKLKSIKDKNEFDSINAGDLKKILQNIDSIAKVIF